MLYGPPSRHCPKCGAEISWQDSVCPKCGYDIAIKMPDATYSFRHMVIADNYSGTIAINASAVQAIGYLESIRDSISSSSEHLDPNFVDYTVKGIDFTMEVIKKQVIERVKDKPEHLEELEKKITEYIKLLRDHPDDEEKFQDFFQENFVFLEPKTVSCMPKKSFGGEGFPDFILTLSDLTYLIVEIETPEKQLYTGTGHPHHDLTKAQQQIRNYLKWARDEKDFLQRRELSNISADNTQGLLVYGMRASLTPTEISNLQALNLEVRSLYQIKTFDDILDAQQAILENLKSII